MTMSVVNLLEVVEIENEQRPRGLIAAGVCELTSQFLIEAPPVEQPGEGIVLRQMTKLAFELLSLTYVLDLRDEIQRGPSREPDQGGVEGNPHRKAPGVDKPLLQAIAVDLTVAKPADLLFIGGAVIRMRDVMEADF